MTREEIIECCRKADNVVQLRDFKRKEENQKLERQASEILSQVLTGVDETTLKKDPPFGRMGIDVMDYEAPAKDPA